jgi:GT2 family glycosyltransferase
MVSIITINYNQTQVTCELLQSLKALTYPNYEVIVVDNASTENPEQIIKQQFPNVQVIVSTTNLGFSGGNNLGMTHAKGDYFFLVNNDTELSPTASNNCWQCIKKYQIWVLFALKYAISRLPNPYNM